MPRRFLPLSDSGFCLTEFLVATTIGLMILAMAAGTASSMRYTYSHDVVRTRINQDLRSVLDLMGINIRQSGENFNSAFPAIEIIDGGGSNPDELYLRKNLVDEVLNVCTAIAANGVDQHIYFATADTTPGCSYSSNYYAYTTWSAFRQASEDDQATAYIMNLASKDGEFFSYTGEFDSGTELRITQSADAWEHDYPVGSAAVYLLEEWHFRVNDGVLELIIDGDTANASRVSYGISDFQVQAVLSDGTVQDSLERIEDWTSIRSVHVELTASSRFGGDIISNSTAADFFPRNVLSN